MDKVVADEMVGLTATAKEKFRSLHLEPTIRVSTVQIILVTLSNFKYHVGPHHCPHLGLWYICSSISNTNV